jgi:hypothetical protein
MFPPGRYGRRREPVRRRRGVGLAALGVVVTLTALIAVKLYGQYGTAAYTPTVLELTNLTDRSVTVEFKIAKPGGGTATCTLDALAVDGSIVGTAQVPVPAGTDVTVTYTVATTSRPYVADVPSCRPAS